MKTKKRIAENKISLNQQVREKELAEVDAQRIERNKERRARFAEMTKEDKQLMRFYKLSLDDLENGADIHEYDPAAEDGDYMRRAKDETEELDDAPKWPSGMDPVKRESLMVLRDLVDLTETARMAGVLRKTAQEP
jgi:carboxyl-terminal processing protease